MEHRQLGRSGLLVPPLSLGTGTFGGRGAFFERWGTTQVDGARKMVDICLEHGVNFFDTADVYSSGARRRSWARQSRGGGTRSSSPRRPASPWVG